MTTWLDPLRAALDASAHPIVFFFRDDDVGWGDERLWPLLDRFRATTTTLDLAVIPALLTDRLTAELRRRVERSNVALHQHGWTHVNHEPEGRRCEFGASRRTADVRADVQRGRAAMTDAFGEASCAVFVPPWNRCSEATAHVLRDTGVRGLSRDATAVPFELPGLAEVPVTVDWFAKRKGAGCVTPAERGQLLANAAAASRPVGVMLHHAVMSDQDMDDAAELADVLGGHDRAVLSSMAELVG
jgi:peptidoglycan/xylan/chitin deacetylase (PgdA/CDA1 family)